MTGVRRAVLALGANLGEPAAALQTAVDGLCSTPGVRCLAVSAVYSTDPVGGPDQPDFLNAVVVVETALPAGALLARAHELEAAAGRVRIEHWGPRTLDVDVVAVGDETSDDPVLRLPHPRAHERAFVLVPWYDADPRAVLPGRGPVADLLGSVDTSGVRRLGDPVLRAPDRAQGVVPT